MSIPTSVKSSLHHLSCYPFLPECVLDKLLARLLRGSVSLRLLHICAFGNQLIMDSHAALQGNGLAPCAELHMVRLDFMPSALARAVLLLAPRVRSVTLLPNRYNSLPTTDPDEPAATMPLVLPYLRQLAILHGSEHSSLCATIVSSNLAHALCRLRVELPEHRVLAALEAHPGNRVTHLGLEDVCGACRTRRDICGCVSDVARWIRACPHVQHLALHSMLDPQNIPKILDAMGSRSLVSFAFVRDDQLCLEETRSVLSDLLRHPGPTHPALKRLRYLALQEYDDGLRELCRQRRIIPTMEVYPMTLWTKVLTRWSARRVDEELM